MKEKTKPVILTVDDDPEVLKAVSRDLRHRYHDHYKILHAGSGSEALQALKELNNRTEDVALLLSDQRMPEMSGIDFLHKAGEIYPGARRVLLTAYADTEAAIQAINKSKIHYYLMKPWDPPGERLYPTIDELLDEWHTSHKQDSEDIRLVGLRWSSHTHKLKDFLTRNLLPYQFMDVQEDTRAQYLAENEFKDLRLPVVQIQGEQPLERPEPMEIAEKLGLSTQAAHNVYDLVVVGAGPAGLAAGVYGASEGLKTVIIEKEAPGGQAGSSSRIENYLGFPSGLSGADLARRAVAQAKKFGTEILTPQEATRIKVRGNYKIIHLTDGSVINCHSLLLTMGVSWRRLNVPGAEKLTGRGIYYGSTMTEAISCKDENVYITGGGNSAGQAALHFSKYASNVHMIIRDSNISKDMSSYLVQQIEENPMITVHLNTEITATQGKKRLEYLVLENLETGQINTVPAVSLFVFIGAEPRTEWLDELIQRDEKGFILTGPALSGYGRTNGSWPISRPPHLLETNVPGIFAAGDVRHGSVKRVASGVGEGSVAITLIHQYLREK